ncbi:MAG: hypothetical protein IJH92_07260 [Mogibacterium sp.]|nr:hypothetical protein [Mogibacterium sp.]
MDADDDPFRKSIFLERAVAGERVRVAMGMSLRPVNEHAPISRGVNESMIAGPRTAIRGLLSGKSFAYQ